MKRIKLSRLSDRQLRRLLGRAEVRFGDVDQNGAILKKAYKALQDYYEYLQNYMRGNGFSALQYNLPKYQKYVPKMAKVCEKLIKEFDERRQDLMALLRKRMARFKQEIDSRNIKFGDPDKEKEFQESNARANIGAVYGSFKGFSERGDNFQNIETLKKLSAEARNKFYGTYLLIDGTLKDIAKHNKKTLAMLKKYHDKYPF